MSSAIFSVIKILEKSNMHFFIERTRRDNVRISATLVGERLEIDCFEDEHIELSRFTGDESIDGQFELLEEIIAAET